MQVTVPQQRAAVRPDVAPVPMPQLRVPDIGLPDHTHNGTPLNRLGDPPAADSDRARRDMSITHALVAQRTPAGDAWARDLDLHGTTAVWRAFADQVQGDTAVAQALVGAALASASTQGGIGKQQWARPRPFLQDTSIKVIGRTPRHQDSSYPSIHAARSYAAARIIATVDPSLTTAAYDMAREVALSRIYAGVHFASDVVAGARLGTRLAESVLERWRDGRLRLAPDGQVEPTAAA